MTILRFISNRGKLLCVVWFCLWLSGCTGLGGPAELQPPPRSEAITEAFPKVAEKPQVILKPGDTIDIKFRYWPELDSTQTILPDGRIALQLVGHIDVAGLTPEALDQHLVKLYDGKILDPVITTIVRTLADQQVYVGGEVVSPGLLPLQPRMSALEAVMAAGGFSRSAELGSVLIVRHADGRRYATAIDLSAALTRPEETLYLGPRDIVYVPRTQIDKVNQWVDQYINKIIPTPIWTYLLIRADNDN